MRKTVTVLALGLLASLSPAMQQKASPHETTSVVVGGATIKIEYGRPYVKGRDVWAGSLAPFGQVWRTGADDATTFETSGDIMLGSLHVPAGKYALFTIPGESEWTVIINKTAKQWGAFKYEESKDLGRAKMTSKKLSSPVEQLTITIADVKGSHATLKIAWSDREASIPIMVH